jgi:hypothetical protein
LQLLKESEMSSRRRGELLNMKIYTLKQVN